MEGKKPFKLDKNIISQIQSVNENTNLQVIEKLRVSGNPGYLPSLIELAQTTGHPTVRQAVFSILDDIKDKGAIPFMIDAINDKKNKNILKNLVESCWQNGLDFSNQLKVFTDLLIEGNDEVSFEAFTVIESMEFIPGDDFILPEIVKIEMSLSSATETRKYFLREAISILKQFTNNQ